MLIGVGMTAPGHPRTVEGDRPNGDVDYVFTVIIPHCVNSGDKAEMTEAKWNKLLSKGSL